jgi:hypothetical protein
MFEKFSLLVVVSLQLAACSSSSPSSPPAAHGNEYDNWSCNCTDQNDAPVAVYAYCGLPTGDAGVAEPDAVTWADNHCESVNQIADCLCSCTDLGTACTTPSSGS